MSNKINILVVDDDPDIGEMLKMMLEFAGYFVTFIKRADKMITLLTAEDFQLIVLDMLIAGDDGNEFCRQLKKTPRFASIPVLMFSAMPNGEQLAAAAGAEGFITKPFEMNAILKKVSSLVGTTTV
ncbi:MAG: response regulator [Agriterribacter sp.]